MAPRYAIGEQDFAGIREEGKVYIDKTGLLYDLVNNGKYIFLSRPRRFGKSLLLSTLQAYFEGRKHLFEGLEIYNLEKEWKKHPVFHLDLSGYNPGAETSLESMLEFQFRQWEKEFGITEIFNDYSQRFREIIFQSYVTTGQKAVILVDEFDSSLIGTLHKNEFHEKNRELLRSIYVNLKSMDRYVRFGMLTGVSRFSKTNIFSALNNLKDISFITKYDTICGFTEKEIRTNLWEGVEALARKRKCNPEEALGLLLDEYDGYHFSENLTDIYTLFSLLNALDNGKIENYWHRSGTPDFLARKLKESSKPFSEIFASETPEYKLSETDTSFTSPVALLYQTGYLTIKGYNPDNNEYELGIPNREVERGLFLFLLGKYTEQDTEDGNKEVREMAKSLKDGNPEGFLERLQSFLASIGYPVTQNKSELFFEQGLYIILRVLGLHVHTEIATSNGRIDLLCETGKYVYIIELNLDKTPEEALKQIEKKYYALPWKFDDRKIFKIGINFSSGQRNITGWKIKG